MADSTLRIHVETDRLPLAEHAGAIVLSMDAAFDNYRQTLPRGMLSPQLRVSALEIDSLIIDMIAVAAAIGDLYENRELLGGFVAQLGDALLYLRGRDGEPPSRESEAAVHALAAPVANDNATRVTVKVIGDNANIFVIDGEVVGDIDAFAVRLASTRGRMPPAATGDPAQVGNSEWPPLFGTALNVGGEWHVRPEGHGGAIYPLGMPKGALDTLLDGARYEFRSHGPAGGKVLAKRAERIA